MPDRKEQTRRAQRAWRALRPRIDFYADAVTLEALRLRREPYGLLSTNSGVLNSIVLEWARLKGLALATAAISRPSARACPGASESGGHSGVSTPLRPRAGDFERTGQTDPPESNGDQMSRRVVCGARRRRDGNPCEAMSVPGKRRCKWHGGCSTGPTSPEGKAKAARNLPRVQRTLGGVSEPDPERSARA